MKHLEARQLLDLGDIKKLSSSLPSSSHLRHVYPQSYLAFKDVELSTFERANYTLVSAMGSVEGPVRTRSWPRPRSPIPCIKRMFSVKSPITARRPPESHRCAIPTDVIRNVGHHTASLRDVLSISLTCQSVRTVLIPRLYATVELTTNRCCKIALEAFSHSPKITHYIRVLTVRPNNVERTPQGDYLDEDFVAGLIMNMAIRMPLLRSFHWDGLEMPDDKLWLTLRQLYAL
ncbi:hypothetical protein C0992_010035 [Termitomyces sp. T32_za158]|nr:hypothetical protein C0992_010035 [Termitomyces sp. T32_za158]